MSSFVIAEQKLDPFSSCLHAQTSNLPVRIKYNLFFISSFRCPGLTKVLTTLSVSEACNSDRSLHEVAKEELRFLFKSCFTCIMKQHLNMTV